MIKHSWSALAAAICCIAVQGQAASPSEEQVAAERLMGSDGDEAQWQSYLPFTRKLHAWGLVVDSFAASSEAAGVPRAAMIEALQALSTAIDPERHVKAGDFFWIQYEQEYTIEGHQVGTGRVLWVELRTAAKGTVLIHRFRVGKSNVEPFWLTTGQSTEMPSVRLPLDRVSISSGFGMRADPIDQPTSRAWATGPGRATPAARQKARASNTLGKGSSTADAEARAMMARAGALPPRPTSRLDSRFERVTITGSSGLTNPALAKPSFTNQASGTGNVSPSLGLSIAVSPIPPSQASAAPSQGTAPRPAAPRAPLIMHQGVDLVADPGTPVLAAGDGIVIGAAPNGGYGNWIEIDHEDNLSSVYGHLSAFATGIEPGVHVQKGDLIGFVGNTGRSTGPHLHFELRSNGKPTNPVNHPSIKLSQLRGGDLDRFRKVVARDLAEAQREGKPK